MTVLSVALKEWAAVCRALAAGRQDVILRKGGIAEAGGKFRAEHAAFLLYPTYFHEHRDGIRPECGADYEEAEADRPPLGTIRLTHYCRVRAVRIVTDLQEALALAPRHILTEEVVRQRFAYRTPGLTVLEVETHPLPRPSIIPERPEYAGCKSWVVLKTAIETGPGVAAGDLPCAAPPIYRD